MSEQRVDKHGAQLAGPSSAAELVHALWRITRAMDGLRWELARHTDLRLIDHMALEYVTNAGKPVEPTDLSNRLGMRTQSGTEFIDRLVRSGHLERYPHPRDGRRIVLRPTPAAAAQESIREQRALVLAAIDELADQLTVEEVRTITTYLGRAAEVITAHTTNAGASSHPGPHADPTVPAAISPPT